VSSITCPCCGWKSHNANDIAQRYCGRCKAFHSEMEFNFADLYMRATLELAGYSRVRKLDDGKWIGVMRMLYTTGLCYGLAPEGYEWRYCYEHAADALLALEEWDGAGDPPGPWLKVKGHPAGERLGPGATA
jgi:hypothetical protein